MQDNNLTDSPVSGMADSLVAPSKAIRVSRSSVVNRANLKRFALGVAEQHRGARFTRVSEEFLNKAEATLRAWCADYVRCRMPSKGKTIK